jgi:uncharacterized membrane protein YbhN (UPF0104 family)
VEEIVEPARASRTRSLAINLVKAGVSLGLLWLLFKRVDMARLWSYARHASPFWLAAALMLYLVMILASAWRWSLLLHAQHLRIPYSFLTSS